jgi:hypothetical protein
MEEKNIMKFAFLLVLLFFFLYDVFFSFLPTTTNVILGALGVGFFPFLLTKDVKRFDNFPMIFLFFLCLCVYAFFSLSINHSQDYSFIQKELVRAVVLPFFAAYFVALFFSKYSHRFLLNLILLVSVIQCSIIILSFFNSSIKEFVVSFQQMANREESLLTYGFRSVGLGIKFDIGSFYLSITMLISCYLYLLSGSKKNIYIAIWLIELIAGMMLARSIFLGVFFSLLFLLLFEKQFTKKMKIIMLFLLFAAALMFLFLFSPDFYSRYSDYLNWIFQYVIESDHKSDTMKALSERMYFLPDDLSTYVFGDGYFQTEKGHPYRGSDPFYMRHILYWGIPGLLLYVSLLIVLIQKLKKIFLNNQECNSFFIDFLNIFLVLIFCIYLKLDYHFFKIIFLFYWFFLFKELDANAHVFSTTNMINKKIFLDE